jgi:hypothetical protein
MRYLSFEESALRKLRAQHGGAQGQNHSASQYMQQHQQPHPHHSQVRLLSFHVFSYVGPGLCSWHYFTVDW